MSGLRHAIRSKLRALGEKTEDRADEDQPDSMDTISMSTELTPIAIERATLLSEVPDVRDEAGSVSTPVEDEDVIHRTDDVSVTSCDAPEVRLEQLQEQLLAAMIHNQELEQSVREQERVQQLYNHEREKCKALEQQLRDFVRQSSLAARARRETEEGYVDVAHEVREETPPHTPESRDVGSWRQKLNTWFMTSFYALMQDFTDEPDVDKQTEDEPLAIKTLKANITRFKEDTEPLFCLARGLSSLFAWHNPTSTVVAFMLYMYAVWHGWLLPLLLSLAILRLSINFLNTKGCNIQLNLVSAYTDKQVDKQSENFSDMGVSDKLTVVLQVATKVQNALGFLADNLEKLWNLFAWQQAEATVQLYLSLCAALVFSCFLPGTLFFKIVALYLGIKMFVIEFIFVRFPRFKQRHDSVYILWQGLPTNAQLRTRASGSQRSPRSADSVSVGSVDSVDSAERVSEQIRTFCDIFTLPYSEKPLSEWQEGKGCALIDRDKGLRHGFKYGKLFLTNSYLCFERHKKQSPKNFTIPLCDITEIKRMKPFSWLPGSGLSIEVTVSTSEKPFLFGAILSRDELFNSIIAHGISAGHSWAQNACQQRHVIGTWHGNKSKSEESTEIGGGKSVKKRHSENDVSESEEKGESDNISEEGTELRHRLIKMSDLRENEGDLL